ncbi:MAG: DMT family transporter [Pseudomonadota bacterium]
MLLRLAPALFVVLWSSGFIAAKLGRNGAEPFTFLSIRFLIVLAIMVPIGAWLASRRLTRGERLHAAVAGSLIHGTYLGGVFFAVKHGMPAGVVALIVSLQPVATAVASGPLLGETVTRRHWLGLVVGLAGSALVLAPRLDLAASGITSATIAAAVLALAGITAGTIYQKRFASRIGIGAGAIWQYLGALAVTGVGSLALETRAVVWTGEFVVALAWLVLVLSVGAISLLMLLIRESAVSRVTGLFYLVPATTALMAWALFGETLGIAQLAGMLLVTIAVLLIRPAAGAGAGSRRSP